MRSAQGSTFWIIIAAVIALVVLIVMLLIFTGKTGALETGLLDCRSKGGDCLTPPCPEGSTISTVFSCQDSTKVCCVSSKKIINSKCEANAECITGKCEGGKCVE